MIYKHHLPADVSILLFSSTEHIQLWDGDDLGELLLLTSLAKLSQKKAFTPGSKRHRMDWETRVASLSDRRFTRRYRVTKEQFDTLLSRLLPELEVVCAKAHSYVSVAPELQLSMTLRFLAGGSYLDIAYTELEKRADLIFRFRWADVRCAGSTHDQLAYTVSGLDNMLKRLPLKYYLVGDNGYIPHEYLLVPYKGKFIRRIDPYKDSFNFHLSQLRIHVERAFGMLTARWGILWKPITTSFAGTLVILTSCFRLHNFCLESSHRIENNSQLGHVQVADEYGRLIDDFEVQDLLTANPASSARNSLCLRREAMVAQLRVEEILRPNTTSENRNKRRHLNFVDEN
eukprot:g38483.t1